MNAGQFARKRAIIAADIGHRGASWRKRALARLIKESGAEEITTQGRTVAYQFDSGAYVCVKHRYVDELSAQSALQEMARIHDCRSKPIRAYPCYSCKGWHLTSMA